MNIINSDKIPAYIEKYCGYILSQNKYTTFDIDYVEDFISFIYEKLEFDLDYLNVRVCKNPLEGKLIFEQIKLHGGRPLFVNELQKTIGKTAIAQTLQKIVDPTILMQLFEWIAKPIDERINNCIISRDRFENEKSESYFGVVELYGALAVLDFIKTELPVSFIGYENILEIKDYIINSGIYGFFFSSHTCVPFSKPELIVADINSVPNNLHGPAIEWGSTTSIDDGRVKQYLIKGRTMPKRIFNKELTKHDFINETNSDAQAGIYEIVESAGEGSMLKLLGAEEVDSQTFIHANGSIEEMTLYKTKEKFRSEIDLNGNWNVPLAWLKMSCPSTNQTYLIPSDSAFDNCVDAAKYHRPDEVPTDIDYSWHQRN